MIRIRRAEWCGKVGPGVSVNAIYRPPPETETEKVETMMKPISSDSQRQTSRQITQRLGALSWDELKVSLAARIAIVTW